MCAAGLYVARPVCTAYRKTAFIRCITLRAISRLPRPSIFRRIFKISVGVIESTALLPIGPKTSFTRLPSTETV